MMSSISPGSIGVKKTIPAQWRGWVLNRTQFIIVTTNLFLSSVLYLLFEDSLTVLSLSIS